MKRTNVGTLCATGLLASFLFSVSSSASAATVFFDNFEDGNTNGWLESAGGIGSTGVEMHNGSNMAFVDHAGSNEYSLSYDFSYLASETLSFDMHAVANISTGSGGTIHSSSGVVISLLNTFNVELGFSRLINNTSGVLGANDNAIDGVQHNYSAFMSDYAALAGLGTSDPIAKIGLTFFANGQTFNGGNVVPTRRSSSTVWFDNVTVGVSAVPVPAAAWLFGSGVLGLIGVARRKKAA